MLFKMKQLCGPGAALVVSLLVIAGTFLDSADGMSLTSERESRRLFGGYRIMPKFCNATRSLLKRDSERRGPTICMFNHECFQRQGEVVGACMDGFLFGTCCELPLSTDAALVTDSLMEQFGTDITESTPQSPLNYAIASQYEKFGSQQSGSGSALESVAYEPVKLEETPTKNNSDSEVKAPNSTPNRIPIFNKLHNNYIGNDELDEDIVQSNLNKHKYELEDSAVSIYSPSTSNIKSEEIEIATTVTPPPIIVDSNNTNYIKVEIDNQHNVYSSEIPSSLNAYNDFNLFDAINTGPGASIETSTDITSAGVQMIASQIYQENQLFDHSDITHPEAETILINENGTVDQSYADPNDFTNHEFMTDILTTEKPSKVTYPKPQFKPKPKPTQGTEPNNYVLVHTISTDSKDSENQTTKPTVSVHNIHSIESIILMLNETNLGPQYETDNNNPDNIDETKIDNVTLAQTTYETTSPETFATASIDYDKYGSTSFFITKPPKTSPPETSLSTKVPSTSYVYSPKPTRRPILEPIVVQATLLTSGYGTTAVTQKEPVISVSTSRPPPTKLIVTAGPSKRPAIITSEPEHSLTSGYYTISTSSPSAPVAISSVQPTKKVTTVPTKRPPPSTTVKLPEYIVQSSTLSHQSPSTLANVNYVHISSASDNPSPTVHITPKPVPGLVTSSTWSNKLPSSTVNQRPSFYENTPPPVYVSSLADFEDEGYFGVTQRPVTRPTISSTAMYTIVDNSVVSNYASSTYSPYGPTAGYQTMTRVPVHSPSNHIYMESTTIKNELYTTPDDINNFPPVRNPNLNLTDSMMGNMTKIENSGIKDDKVNMLVNKIVESFNGNFEELEAILKERKNITLSSTTDKNKTTTRKPVTKKKKKRPSGSKKPSNGTSTSTNSSKKPTTAKPTVIQQDTASQTTVKPSPKPSKKPSKKRPSNSTKPTSSSSSKPVAPTTLSDPTKPAKPSSTKPKPSSSSTRPKPTSSTSGSKPAADDAKPPATTKKPNRPSTSKKPSKKPTSRPTLADTEPVTVITTRKPTKATKRTTKRPTTTTTSTTTTTTAPEDEIIEEEEETVDEEEEEEDVGEETNETIEGQAQGTRRILCGQRPLMKSARVVGGKAAKFGEWPWQVLVRESTWLGLFTKNKCGGVLITNEYVITAAHCQPGFLASLVAVFGEFDISSDLETKRSVTKNVKRVIVHRQYDAATFENDLAILELESPIHYDVHIVPICMPADEADFTGRMATVTGWGRLTYGGGVPSVLQEVQVPVIENSVCQEMFHMAGHNKKILPSFVCAGYANGKRDSCEGDSGGPLVLQRADGRYELVGTVSHGIRCAAPYLPGVYMRTTFYKPWLRSVTGVK
ncbi:serine protease filzig [Sabethes cyaneus]|uniref:serine protease filzig n=1 Tax=Sabethes cyaneus TaxID=53552 RepID=UPI00237E44ED|nr:serine protease filzig [Sabethes cyaneus]XP_053693560.1 serine protease filzig [Sabethes cyaneus]